MNPSSDLGNKNISVESVAKKALEDEKVLSKLIEGFLQNEDKKVSKEREAFHRGN